MRAQTFQNGRKNNPPSVVKLAAKRNGTAKRRPATTVVELAGGPANAAREDLRPGLVAGGDSAARSPTFTGAASGEKMEKAMKKWSENVEAFSRAGSAVSHAAQEISREWIGWTRTGAQNSRQGFMALMRCRSPQEFFEVQGQILNLNLELLTASTKRMTEISAEMTSKASRKITPAA